MKRVIALGFFDGVHLGHGALLKKTRQEADRLGCKAAALTFDRHPDEILLGKKIRLLNTAKDRETIMKEVYGIDEVLVLPFDAAMMQMSWEDFAKNILMEKFEAEAVVCGHDFRFGHKGQGSAEELRDLFGENCHVIEPVTVDGQIVSSTVIRRLLKDRDVTRANRMLGHEHFLTSTVIHGKHLGRKIGIPTANLLLPDEVMPPAYGVYISKANGHPAVTNIGFRPTMEDGDAPTVESWLLDFKGNLYGKTMKVELVRFLRPEKRFDSVAQLQEQIHRDAQQVREYFDPLKK